MEANLSKRCGYPYRDGGFCTESAGASGLCFWHDPDQSKEIPDLIARLEERVRRGGSLEGFELAHARLAGARLLSSDRVQGVDATNANLSHADLSHAHLFRINLEGANLFKAKFHSAHMNHANLEGTDLLQARFVDATLDHVNWGRRYHQHQRITAARRRGDRDAVRQNLQQLSEVYRHLRQVHEQQGLFLTAGDFFHKEMVTYRRLLPLFSFARFLSKLVDLTSGYSEKPARVVFSALAVVCGCALVYYFGGVEAQQGGIEYHPAKGLKEMLWEFGDCLYFSFVTFTTLGYGDIVPKGWLKAVAALEAFAGAFGMALFVVVYAKKMSR